ncbi:MAG: Hsp20/alpha crystallin family protein [Cyanobacteria bacterium P01_A01_bin.84]
MKLVRYNPWGQISTLERQINRIFDDLTPAQLQLDSDMARVPAAEISQTKDALNLKIELPGINTKDLDIQVAEKSISVSGERKREIKSEENGNVRSEFQYGRFERVISLPARVENTKVSAKYEDGILHLTLPLSQAEKNKVVKVSLTSDAE